MTEEVDDEFRCMFGDGKKATRTMRVEGKNQLVFTCAPCEKELLAGNKKKRCQYCGIPIKPNWKKSALDGFEHEWNCPRYEVLLDEEVTL